MNWPGLLHQLAPEAHQNVVEAFQSAETVFSDFHLSNPLRQAHFLAQASHETGGFHRLDENLNYSAAGLVKTWPERFPQDVAEKCAHKPEMIANRAYQGRMGNKAPGDGFKYRGRGVFQLTGRNNYEAMGKRAQLPLLIQPDLAFSSRYLLPIALHFWNERGLSALADQDDLAGITYRVNGSVRTVPERSIWLSRWKEALGV